MLKMRARFYGVKCWASVENGIPTLTGTGYFNKKALTIAVKYHQFKSWIAGKPLPLEVEFEEELWDC